MRSTDSATLDIAGSSSERFTLWMRLIHFYHRRPSFLEFEDFQDVQGGHIHLNSLIEDSPMRSSTGTEDFPVRTSQCFLPYMSINTFSLMAPVSTNSGGGRSNHLAFVWGFKDTFVFKLIDV